MRIWKPHEKSLLRKSFYFLLPLDHYYLLPLPVIFGENIYMRLAYHTIYKYCFTLINYSIAGSFVAKNGENILIKCDKLKGNQCGIKRGKHQATNITYASCKFFLSRLE